MTIDYTVPHETTSLVKPSKPNFYPQAKINLQHNQLKHRISTRDTNAIYYCTSYEIYALQIDTQTCGLVKSLSWEPKCLDAAYGWICAAALKGKCVFIQIGQDQVSQLWARPRQRRAEVDELLPLDLDPASRSFSSRDVQHLTSTDVRMTKYTSHHHVLGTDIVNSVTIHKMQSVGRGLEDDIVAILTNNDKTVRIFSLSQSKPLVTLTYPVAMNHATLSPDGDLLLAVGDKGQAFFHRRVPFENPTVVGDKVFPTFGWIAVGDPLLPQVAPNAGCFCTGFSHSGQRCAVASESGVIVIYDTSLITDEIEQEDAIVCVMTTSRPTALNFMGAARSMSFSPAPWDLLVVAEDQGRVTVLDTRSPAFMFRQILDLSTDPSHVVTTNIREVQDTLQQRQVDIEQRLLQSHREAMENQSYLAATTNTASHLESRAESQLSETEQLNNEVQALAESAGRLTESQRRIIESIGLRYARANTASPPSSMTAPITVNHTSSSSSRDGTASLPPAQVPLSVALAANRPSLRENTDGFSSNADNLSPSPYSANPAITGREHQIARTASIAEYVHLRNVERERQRTVDRQPRRRSSVVISNSSSRNNHRDPSSLAPIGTSTPTFSTSPSRLPSSISSNSSPVPPANPNDTTPPSRTASSLTIPEYWPTPEDWRTASIEATATATNNNQPGDASSEVSAIVARARREAGVSTDRRTTSNLRPANGTSAALPDPRIYQQTMQSLLARTEMARNELQRNENELAARQISGIDFTRAGMERVDRAANRMERAANRMRDSSQTQAADAVRLELQHHQSRAGGVVVQGVGWSRDGRSLFVATEAGLLQYEVNIRERMQWPGVAFL